MFLSKRFNLGQIQSTIYLIHPNTLPAPFLLLFLFVAKFSFEKRLHNTTSYCFMSSCLHPLWTSEMTYVCQYLLHVVI